MLGKERRKVGKSEGERPLERPRCRWVDNIKFDRGDMGWVVVGWIGLAQDRDKWRESYCEWRNELRVV
jgi:hypothetical protein